MNVKSALLMIEFQNEWLEPEGKLHHLFRDSSLLKIATRNADSVLTAARNSGMHIVHTAMGFSEDYSELGQTQFGMRGAIAYHRTWQGWSREHAYGFEPKSGEFIIDRKVAASAFAFTPLDLFLRNNQINRIYLCGFALQVCVSATGWAAHDLGYEVVVLEDACAAFEQAQQKFVLEHLVHHFGKRMTTAQFQQSLGVRHE